MLIHNGAEHTIDGKRHPVEVQVIHTVSEKDAEFVKLPKLALSVLVTDKGDGTPLKESDVTGILNSGSVKTYYSYEGSLTIPPCTEEVTWLILKDPVMVATNYLNGLKLSMPETYRAIKPIGERSVRTVEYTVTSLGASAKVSIWALAIALLVIINLV